MRNELVRSRKALKEGFQEVSKAAGIRLDTRSFACAFSERAAIAQVGIKGSELTSPEQMAGGVDMCLAYIAPPNGVATTVPETTIRANYYIVNVSFNSKTRRGIATLFTPARREVATVPLQVKPIRGAGEQTGNARPLSGYINWCGAGIDFEWDGWWIEISFDWCEIIFG